MRRRPDDPPASSDPAQGKPFLLKLWFWLKERFLRFAIKPWFRLFALLKYAIAFAFLLLVLPLTAFSGVPLHDLLGGLFVDHEFAGGFWVALGALATAWSIMFTQGLLVDDQEGRVADAQPVVAPEHQAFWNHQAVPRQLLIFSLTAMAAIVVVILKGDPWYLAAVGVLCGIATAIVILFLLCTPARLVARDAEGRTYSPLNVPAAEAVWRTAARGFPGVTAFARGVFRLPWRTFEAASQTCCLKWFLSLGLDAGAERRPRQYPAAHFFAVTNLLGIVACLAVIAAIFPPHSRSTFIPPAAAYVFVMTVLGVWVFGFLQFHLKRLSLSPLWFILVASFILYAINNRDHYFHFSSIQTAAAARTITPADVVATGGAETNLVVVTASGGGILSAAWTTYSLHRLIGARPELAREIKLISGVSGGSVGAAFYVTSMAELSKRADLNSVISNSYHRAARSSLGAVAYGLSMVDLPRVLTGGLLPPGAMDRGRYLEEAWRRHALPEPQPRPGMAARQWHDITLREVTHWTTNGTIPSLIFGSTVMETGERVMLTGLTFPVRSSLTNEPQAMGNVQDSAYQGTAGLRAPTHREYLQLEPALGLPLWTAARLSATFPYVTPAARPELSIPSDKSAASRRRQFHFLDGGYYDNYGVAAALDWLEEVLRERVAGRGPPFRRVLIIQFRAFEPKADDADPKGGFISAIAGPLVGLTSVYGASAATRNDIALRRFMGDWNGRLAALDPPVVIESVVLERTHRMGPLSWHLTRRNIADLTSFWPSNPPPETMTFPDVNRSQTLTERWAWLNAFLSGKLDQRVARPADPALR
jgi:hypothetical protein